MVSLMRQFKENANTLQIANTILSTWQDVDVGLRPIIGPRGVAALYKRTLYLTSRTYPWLAGAHEGTHTIIDFDALKAAFEQQNDSDAADAGNALLETFYELLTTLVGTSLTKRLLRSI
jgi:hypothetical protein